MINSRFWLFGYLVTTDVIILLIFLLSSAGLSCTPWTMKVQDQVNGTLGQNVILPCFFTHPKQNAYTGDITVKWMQGKINEPIFQCIFHNKTNGQNSNCTAKQRQRLLLQGDHRKGDISLRINNLQFTDASQYTCRVELDYDKFNKHTTLNVNGKIYTAFVLTHTYTVTQKVCFWTLKSHLME